MSAIVYYFNVYIFGCLFIVVFGWTEVQCSLYRRV